METASLGLPTVNIGLRQYGGSARGTLLDAKADKQSILEGIEKARCNSFMSSLEEEYDESLWRWTCGREDRSKTLASVPLGADLLRKRTSNQE